MKKEVKRLYAGFNPKHYDLQLAIEPDKKHFSGTVTITGRKTGRPSKRFTFHQHGLTITEATVERHDKKSAKSLRLERINTHKRYDEVRLHLSETAYPGEYTVRISFEGTITEPMNGIYPCNFTHDGADKQLIATQFESHHAREVFPCIDEPQAKAAFDLTITAPAGLTVLGNTPAAKTMTNAATQTVSFETSPVMSTYLLTFVIGDMGYKEAVTQNGTVVRTYATPDNVALTDFALDTAVRVLEFYEDYFGIPYPLAKCDMVALPDFASGAMENWGLITYREQTMLVDPVNTSVGTKQYVAMVVAHELAHQWFGNLVTMEWWTDLWLNEGFASWIEYLAVDHLYPEWDMWTQFIVDEQQPAMKLDALDNTHAIEVPVHHPDEIRTIFDAISYHKGASVIHMLHEYLGAEAFRKGLSHYLLQHAYQNTRTTDLWQALEAASGKPVAQFMAAWTSQPGFPIVRVSGADGAATALQERFYMLRPDTPADTTWPIPLLSAKAAGTAIMTDKSLPLVLDAAYPKINGQQAGFYRTVYSREQYQSLVTAIKGGIVGPLDRLGLLADSFEAAKAGYGSVTDGLKLLEAFAHETNAAVWDIMAGNIGELRRIMDDESFREALKPYVRRLVSNEVKRLGWDTRESDSHFDKLLRPTILGMASAAEHPEVLAESRQRFDAAESSDAIPADVRGVVFGTVARTGTKKDFDKLLRFHNAASLSEERNTLAAALTNFRQPALVQAALELVDSKTVRRQDAMTWVAYSFMNRHAKHATWQWLTEHWQWLDKTLGSDLSFYRTPIYAARSFSDPTFLPKYDAFFADKQSPALERSIKQGREILQWQIDWKRRDLAAATDYLTNRRSA